MFQSLTKFVQPTQSSHIVRRGRFGQLAAPRARIPLADRCRRALRGAGGKPSTCLPPRAS
eukprot:5093109-Pyramimonas_sp.AAC.1